MTDARSRLMVKAAALRLAITTRETPLAAECRRQRERDASLKAASAAKVAQYQAGSAA